jgi:hypothetical protein
MEKNLNYTFNHTNYTTNPRCQQGHCWTYGGSINFNLEGHPCDCGMVVYHSEPCKCCEQIVQKHQPNPNFVNPIKPDGSI